MHDPFVDLLDIMTPKSSVGIKQTTVSSLNLLLAFGSVMKEGIHL
jgi:hypothetical protein